MSSPAVAVLDPARLEQAPASRLIMAGRVAAVAGIALAAAAAFVDQQRFAFSYLVGFWFVLTLSLGGLFFVVIQHLTRAGWSVGVRRQMEWGASFLPFTVLLFIPLAVLAPKLYEWMGPEAAHDELLHKKAGYLNVPFFYVRAAIYFAIWAGLSLFFTRTSRRQDETGDHALTMKMRWFSAPAAALFALSLTFASFDWLMSLQPHWYSTIWGVYLFAGSVASSLGLLALGSLWMNGRGLLKRVLTVEHRHDVGKLFFGFTVFWAYIAFSQYFLIWYANIPEETVFYLNREPGGWLQLSQLMVVCQFLIPFVLLISRHGKRNSLVLAVAAAIGLVGHYLDLYWLVLPIHDKAGVHLSWMDLAGLAGPLGLFFWWLTTRIAGEPLYPTRDPLLHESVRLDNA